MATLGNSNLSLFDPTTRAFYQLITRARRFGKYVERTNARTPQRLLLVPDSGIDSENTVEKLLKAMLRTHSTRNLREERKEERHFVRKRFDERFRMNFSRRSSFYAATRQSRGVSSGDPLSLSK